MPFTKKIPVLVSVVVLAVFIAIMSLSTYFQTENSLKMRTIDTEEIGTLSYNEQIDKMLDEFDYYTYDFENNEVKFSASVMKNLSDFTGYQLLNTIDDSEITKNFRTNFNCDTQEFTLITEYVQNEQVLKTIEQIVEPVFDEDVNDYFIVLDDGTKLSVAQTLQLDNLNTCVALVDDAAILAVAVVAIFAITIVVAAPEIVKAVETVVTTVVTWVKSFWSWFCSLWKPKTKTVVSTITTTSITYPVTIDNTTYKLKKYEKGRYFDEKLYYLAIADTDDGLMYMSTVHVKEEVALAVLCKETLVNSGHQHSSKKFVLSVYTVNQQIADNLATKAGGILQCPGRVFHKATKVGYFNHFHPGAVYHEPHCFFGYPREV